MILGIDCSASPSGGGKRHLTELLKNFDPQKHKIVEIKLWAGEIFLNSIPNYPWLIKFTHPFLNKSPLHKLYWQFFIRDKSFKNQFDLLFSPFGTYTGKKKPYVSMSRNMLIFDKTERNRFFFSFMWLKLNFLFFIQKKSFENSNGVIFISKYAKEMIANIIGIKTKNAVIINHGVSSNFINQPCIQYPINHYSKESPFKILFLSSIWVYKHPIKLLDAINLLHLKGYPIQLIMVGDDAQKNVSKKVETKIQEINKYQEIIFCHKSVGLEEVSTFYTNSNLFVFTSTCENMPNILLEAMASGLPICCSSFPPMPEFLEKGGMYFNPTDSLDIANTLEKAILEESLRNEMSIISQKLSEKYTWEKCANETFKFLYKINLQFN
jgi:glycosyltransferase involved in cell wall biosynthesis